ncbi:MAG TPA: glycerol-3-phosphate dehydrogenase [Candidatus Magasanikbacteria bacterium]|nr:glycerol-3-phosphate dehydrogenase [Candidatus Magasanikbacteria bacterium]
MKKQTITILGAGSMGTALAQVLATNGHEVRIWNWEGEHEPLKQIEKNSENKKYLPGVKLSKNIIPKFKIEEALFEAKVVFFVIPSGVLEHTVSFAARSISNDAILVDVSKGLDCQSLQVMSQIIAKHVRTSLRKNIVTISGPSIAIQMVSKQYTAMNIASKNNKAIKKVIAVLENNYIKLVPTSDVIGVEIGGSFKNVYAIAMGMCDGLGYSLNTKAALLTYALEEISQLIKVAGGKRHTAYELAGLGDLIGTSLCPDSRNRLFGEYLGKGVKSSQAIKKVGQTVEGVGAVQCLLHLANRHHIHTPFAKIIYACVTTTGDSRRIFKEFVHSL